MKFNKIIYIAIVGLFSIVSCSNSNDAKEEKQTQETNLAANQIIFTPEQYKLGDIQTGKIQKRNLSDLIKLNGNVKVKPESIVSIAIPFGGYLKSNSLIEGQKVKKGELVAQIENPLFIDMQQEYLKDRSQLTFLEKEYKRQSDLRKEEINSEKSFQKTKADYQSMKANVQALKKKLQMLGISIKTLNKGEICSYANFYAPISGTISYSGAVKGQYIEEAKNLYQIENKSDVYLSLSAFENSIGGIEEGQKVMFSTSKENQFKREAEVTYTGIASGNDQVIPVSCKIKEEDTKDLLSGMYVKAWIEKGKKLQDVLPNDAFVQLAGKDYIIIEKENHLFELVEVLKGKTQENLTAVVLPSNFNKNEKVVVNNAYTVLSAIKNLSEEE
ncbi:MAG: efflux RND transporter periplasmic adaptor subunit [Bacteroidales bacterium]